MNIEEGSKCSSQNYGDKYICDACHNPRYGQENTKITSKDDINIEDNMKQYRKAIATMHVIMYKRRIDMEDQYVAEIEELSGKLEKIQDENQYLFDEIEIIQQLFGYSIYQIIPTKLNDTIKSKFNRVFYGFIRYQCKNEDIPSDIIYCIVTFYPCLTKNKIDDDGKNDLDNNEIYSALKNESEALEDSGRDSRRNSIYNLQKNMLDKMMDASVEYRHEINSLKIQLKNIENQVKCLFNDFKIIEQLCGYSIYQIIPQQLNNTIKNKFGQIIHGFIRLKCDHDQYGLNKKNLSNNIIDCVIAFYQSLTRKEDRDD